MKSSRRALSLLSDNSYVLEYLVLHWRRLPLALLALIGVSACVPMDFGEIPQPPDVDGDGFYAVDIGNVAFPADCDDTNPSIKPDAEEKCDSIDNNCNNTIDEGFDLDGDGFKVCENDCNDTNEDVRPSANELCNDRDDDCDRNVDEGLDQDGDGVTWCIEEATCPDGSDEDPDVAPFADELCDGKDNNCDGDIDEFDIADNGTSECVDDDEDGYTEAEGDCDDEDRKINPKATETCNGKDDNCDSQTDNTGDKDKDGVSACTDCDDNNAQRAPGKTEVCDQIDNDCDEDVDEGFDVDADADGVTICTDCDDNNPDTYPGRSESCDGFDNDCDQTIDEGFDADGDGYTSCRGDCDDSNRAINPLAVEVCDNVDNDCDGEVDDGFDEDQDGSATCENDCDDTDATVYPGALELCEDARDNDCDEQTDEETDEDSDSMTNCQGDCDDSDPATYSGAAEVCDLADNNCDGTVDDGFDADFDGATSCGGDCDDANATVFPGALELCTDTTDNDCDGTTNESVDEDKDGRTNCAGDCRDDDPTVYPGAVEVCNDKDNNCSGGNGDYLVKGSGGGDFTTIQTAISGASNGCSVVVSDGLYSERIDFKGKALHLRSLNGPTKSIIDGGKAGTVVTFKSGEGPSSILDGFTIQNGTGTKGLLYYFGGGIHLSNNSAPVIQNNRFLLNAADYGGAIYAYDSQAGILDNSFSGNIADYGGAIYLDGYNDILISGNTFDQNQASECGGAISNGVYDEDAALIEDNVFTRNSSDAGGALCADTLEGEISLDYTVVGNLFQGNEAGTLAGAIYLAYATVEVSQNVFKENTALATNGTSGALHAYSSSAYVHNNLFLGNKAVFGGASGIFGASGATRLENNTYYANQASTGKGGSIYLEDVTPLFVNNLLTFDVNGGSFVYTQVKVAFDPSKVKYNDFFVANNNPGTTPTGLSGTNGNISADPLYVDRFTALFTLSSSSPAINAGDPSILDPDGSRSDMGAFGGPAGSWSP